MTDISQFKSDIDKAFQQTIEEINNAQKYLNDGVYCLSDTSMMFARDKLADIHNLILMCCAKEKESK